MPALLTTDMESTPYPEPSGKKKNMSVRSNLSVFLDETGLFDQSQRHLMIALGLARTCSNSTADGIIPQDGLSSVELRRVVSTPTVFNTTEYMHQHRATMLCHLRSLRDRLPTQQGLRNLSKVSDVASGVIYARVHLLRLNNPPNLHCNRLPLMH